MNKMMIFVEGDTELLFINKLVSFVAHNSNVSEKPFSKNRALIDRRFIKYDSSKNITHYFISIRNCGGDENVVPQIKKQYNSLKEANYQEIIGIRDVYPSIKREKIKEWMGVKRFPEKPIKPMIVLATMEIEAWFLAEHSHFLKIDKKLTTKYIRSKLKFDPSDDMSFRNHPADDMKKVYKLAKKEYIKPSEDLTISNLDYNEIALNLPNSYSDLKLLVDKCFDFFN